MIVKTKYNPGDILYFLHDSKVVQEKVDYISIDLSRSFSSDPIRTKIMYAFGVLGKIKKAEGECFKSLPTLKKSLIINKK